jgi:acyl carrier protein
MRNTAHHVQGQRIQSFGAVQSDEPHFSLLRDQVDLDSMDWLNFLVRLHKRFDVDIPESQYASLRTIDDLTNYIDQHR